MCIQLIRSSEIREDNANMSSVVWFSTNYLQKEDFLDAFVFHQVESIRSKVFPTEKWIVDACDFLEKQSPVSRQLVEDVVNRERLK